MRITAYNTAPETEIEDSTVLQKKKKHYETAL